MRRLFFGGVDVKDGSKYWSFEEINVETQAFTVPPGIKRIKVSAEVYFAEDSPDIGFYALISNVTSNNMWGEGYSTADDEGDNMEHKDIESIVGVTPNKTYTLYFECADTHGVTFSWGKAINAMTPTVEDY